MFTNKVLLITGGTGSFGNAVLRRFLDSQSREIRIFSRDEKKQDDMRKRYNSPKLKFYIGDVRDYQSVVNAVRGVSIIYHAAPQAGSVVSFTRWRRSKPMSWALRTCWRLPFSAMSAGWWCSSTDKAVYPINAMGISKAMMEKVAVAESRSGDATTINVTRYGNVMCFSWFCHTAVDRPDPRPATR